MLSALTIIVLSPLLVLISLLIMLDDSSAEPVFCQKRCGKNLFWQAQQGRCQLSFEEWEGTGLAVYPGTKLVAGLKARGFDGEEFFTEMVNDLLGSGMKERV